MESMISVENLEIEKWYEGGDTVPVTQGSHHLVLLPSLWNGPRLISQDESYGDIQTIYVLVKNLI